MNLLAFISGYKEIKDNFYITLQEGKKYLYRGVKLICIKKDDGFCGGCYIYVKNGIICHGVNCPSLILRKK